MFIAEREGFEPPEVLPSTVFKTAAIDHSAISPICICAFALRREGDSNPRYAFDVYTLSRRASSATRASLQISVDKGSVFFLSFQIFRVKVFNNSRICCWSEDEYDMKMLGWGSREAGTVEQMAEAAPVCRDVLPGASAPAWLWN